MKILYVIGQFSVIEPMGILQLAAITRAAGHTLAVGACEDRDLLTRIGSEGVNAVALSFMTTEAREFKALVSRIRGRYPKMIIIAGGPHATYFTDLIDTWPLDALVVGEGDRVIVPLLEALHAGKSPDGIPGVHTRTARNRPGQLVEDLDSLPFPDRTLVDQVHPLKYVRMKSFFATRGCPFSCTYCFNSAYNALYKGKILRRRSVANLIAEVELVVKTYKTDFIRFGDDTFVMEYNDWVEEFCREYAKRIRKPFYFLIHPNFVKEDLVKALRAAGCHSVMMGIESGDVSVRQRVLNRFVSDERLKQAFDLFRKHKIKVFANTILALPDTTLEDDKRSMEFTLDCHPFYSGFTVFTPFPKTVLGEYARQKGYVKAVDDWMEAVPVSMQHGSCLLTVTPRQKEIHHNILILGPVANLFPFLRKWITRSLIYWKPNPIFNAIGFLVRNYCNMHIWPFKKGPMVFVRLLWKVVRIDRKNYD